MLYLFDVRARESDVEEAHSGCFERGRRSSVGNLLAISTQFSGDTDPLSGHEDDGAVK